MLIPTHRRLLLVDTDMGHETVDKIRAYKQDDVEFCNMSFSNLDECCGVMRDIVAGCGGSINYVGIATHEANLRGNSLLNTRFIEGIRGLFPLPEDRVLTSALDFFACGLRADNTVLRLYSHEVTVPIYFSTNMTGLDDTKTQGTENQGTAKPDWVMECRMDNGVCIPSSARNLSDIYLVAEKVNLCKILFGAPWYAATRYNEDMPAGAG